MLKHQVKPITAVETKARIRYHELYSPTTLKAYSDRQRNGETYIEMAREIGCTADRLSMRVRDWRRRWEPAPAGPLTARALARRRWESRRHGEQ